MLPKNRYEHESQSAVGSSPRAFTVRDRIDQAIASATEQVKAAERAKELLERNPDMEELMNLLARF